MRSPRRSFAAPFVVTLASACTTAPPPPPSPPNPAAPAGPTEQPPANPPQPIAPPIVHGNPPPPEDPAPAPPTETRWFLTMAGGKCTTRAAITCPKNEPGKPMIMCNPPGPRPYECPPGMTNGTELAIVQHGSACVIPPPSVSCPPKAMCNPPPPREVPCPH